MHSTRHDVSPANSTGGAHRDTQPAGARMPRPWPEAMDALCAAADRAVEDGANILILSDRGVDREHAAIPALLALAGVHHHLVRQGSRTRVGLVVESGEPREIHHFALLIGYGAGAINPYLALETLADMTRQGLLTGVTAEEAQSHYIKAVIKGVVKVMSKMGICTIDGYRGAQIFEALGLEQGLVDRYFTGTSSRVGGAGIDVIARRNAAAPPHRLRAARRERRSPGHRRPVPVALRWRVSQLQPADRAQAAGRLPHGQLRRLPGILGADQRSGQDAGHAAASAGLRRCPEPVPIDEVESVEAICKRFKTGAMSYGSISPEAHEALAIAMNRIGGKSNSGEGGEDPARYRAERERRPALQRDQAGRVRPFRRHQLLSEQCAGDPDQDRPGRETRRGRPVARPQSLSLDRAGAALDARRGPDLAPAAPRHLLHRRPGRADL